ASARSSTWRSRPLYKEIAPPPSHGSTSSIGVSPLCRTLTRGLRLRCSRAPSSSPLAMLSTTITLTSTPEQTVEVHRDQSGRCLCRADRVADYRGVVCYNGVAPDRGPFRLAAQRVASRAVRVRRLHHCVIVDGAHHRRPLRFAMSDAEAKSERGKSADLRVVSSARPAEGVAAGARIRIRPLLITFAAIALAAGLGWVTWNTYMEAPWTRDGTVRVYTVTMAPEVAGRIVELPVADNQFVAKGELL